VRELREELGVELSLPLGSPFGRLTDAATQIEMTIWLIDYDGAVANRSPEEHDELRWIAAREISGLALAHSGYAAIFDRALHT
jgi:8-oxo-dGTP pyrophosphatase MutT (NUDIX family)